MAEPSDARTPSPLYRLIEAGLYTSLAEYVAATKATMTWREMAEDLRKRTGITVSWNTLRLWFADRIEVEVTVR